MRDIALHGPDFCNNIQDIDINITKAFEVPHNQAMHHKFSWPQKYRWFLELLSLDSRRFLGEYVNARNIEELVRTSSPRFPALRNAKIRFHGCDPNPRYTYPDLSDVEGADFYLVPFESSPKLQQVHFAAHIYRGIIADCGSVAQDGSGDLITPRKFSDTTSFHVMAFYWLRMEDVDDFAETFPKLRELKIPIYNTCISSHVAESGVYTSIIKFKYLEKLTMPWPKVFGNSTEWTVHPRRLREQVLGWRNCGLYNLEEVTYIGIWRQPPDDLNVPELEEGATVRAVLKYPFPELGMDEIKKMTLDDDIL
ncbi:hypothetical protein TWF730_008679 [Orbilia blumenaviensis]|uniref:Uncharacterized protein n=1 Tax=Orbilia blumenaviensis TaxID=1796055 RepID=A0AAV9V321_9PEZI